MIFIFRAKNKDQGKIPSLAISCFTRAAVNVVTITFPKLETARNAFISRTAPASFHALPIVSLKNCPAIVWPWGNMPSCGMGTTISFHAMSAYAHSHQRFIQTYAIFVNTYRRHIVPTLHRDMPLNLVMGFLISPRTYIRFSYALHHFSSLYNIHSSLDSTHQM